MNDGLKRSLIGRIISAKMNKTIVVLVERRVKHKIYDKIVVRSKKYHAHDEENKGKIGDLVEIQESRPKSKSKKWVLLINENNNR